LAWEHVDRPGDVLSVGDEVEVYVLDVDRERERISLSRKRLLPDPWYGVTDSIEVGQVIAGTVTNVRDFGAFVDVGHGIEGLIHVSEMPVGRATLTELTSGEPVQVRVLEIDHDRRRIALSLRGIAQSVVLPPVDDAENDAAAGEDTPIAAEDDATPS
jgi:small subunit ribosomal protein S1